MEQGEDSAVDYSAVVRVTELAGVVGMAQGQRGWEVAVAGAPVSVEGAARAQAPEATGVAAVAALEVSTAAATAECMD